MKVLGLLGVFAVCVCLGGEHLALRAVVHPEDTVSRRNTCALVMVSPAQEIAPPKNPQEPSSLERPRPIYPNPLSYQRQLLIK